MTTSLLGTMHALASDHLNRYLVGVEFDAKLLGGQPRAKSILEASVSAQLTRENEQASKAGLPLPHKPEEIQAIIDSHKARMADRLIDDQDPEVPHEAIETAWTTFYHDDKGRPYIGNHQVKAALREMASSTGLTQSKRGSKQTVQHLQAVWGCDPSGEIPEGEGRLRIYLWRESDGPNRLAIVPKVDGFVELTGNVQTPQGPRNIIKRHDYVEKARAFFVIEMAARLFQSRDSAALSDEDVATLLLHAQANALGACRSQGYGTFRVVQLDKLTDNPAIVRTPKKGKSKSADDDGDGE